MSAVIGIVFFVYNNHKTPPLHAALAPTTQRVATAQADGLSENA